MLTMKGLKAILCNHEGAVISSELQTRYDSRKSFYKKAIVKNLYDLGKGITLLYSYNTLVCAVITDSDKKYYIINDEINDALLYSNTTLRHIKEFLHQGIGFVGNKGDIIANNRKEMR